MTQQQAADPAATGPRIALRAEESTPWHPPRPRPAGRPNVLVVLLDDVMRDPLGVSRSVYRFLGVDEQFVPPGLVERYNPSYVSRSRMLAGVKDAAYGATRWPALRWAWDAAAGLGLRSIYRGVNHAASDEVIPPPQPGTLAVLRQRFEPEVRELEQLLGRPLPGWLARGRPMEVAA